jgi:SAM-dependent methyltransferase
MKALDRFLQRRRIAMALRWIPPGSRVLDIGCSEGALFRAGAGRIVGGLGLDPDPVTTWPGEPFAFRRGRFPDAIHPDDGPFDAITMLAVFEHVPADVHRAWVDRCRALLRPGGRAIITVPSAAVDPILDGLRAVRLIDGMALEEHHGFTASETPGIFAAGGLPLVRHRRFQLGLNNLYVVERPARAGTAATATTGARPVPSAGSEPA